MVNVKPIKSKSEIMLGIEKQHNNKIEEILRAMYVDEDMSVAKIGKELGISYVTVLRWLQRAGIYSRRLKVL